MKLKKLDFEEGMVWLNFHLTSLGKDVICEAACIGPSWPPQDIRLAPHQFWLLQVDACVGGIAWVVENILHGSGGVLGAWLSCLGRVTAHSHLLRILSRPASVDGEDIIPRNMLLHHPLQRLLSLGSWRDRRCTPRWERDEGKRWMIFICINESNETCFDRVGNGMVVAYDQRQMIMRWRPAQQLTLASRELVVKLKKDQYQVSLSETVLNNVK